MSVLGTRMRRQFPLEKLTERILRICAVAVLIDGIVPGIGWLLRVRGFATLGIDGMPVRPATALAFTALGLALWCFDRYRRAAQIAGVVSAVFGIIGALAAVLPGRQPWVAWAGGSAEYLGLSQHIGDVPILSAVALIALGIAIVCYRRLFVVGHILAIVVLLISHEMVLSKIFGADMLYSFGNPVTMSLPVALTFGFASVGVLMLIPERGLVSLVVDHSSAGVLVRRIIIVVPVGLALLSWLTLQLHERGNVDHPTVAALLSVFGLLIVTVVAWLAASRMKIMEAARQQAFDELAEANRDLERRVAQRTAEIRLSTAHFAAAFESAPVGMAILDLTGTILRANDAFLTKLRHHTLPADFSFHKLVHPDDKELHATNRRQLLTGKVNYVRVQLRLLRVDRTLIWTSVTAALLRDRTGAQHQILVHVIDISDEKTHQAELEHLASHDPLTGALNRRGFDEVLSRHIARCRRAGDGGALLLVDLDHFKGVNDALGHQCGDDVLLSVVEALRNTLRSDDVIARLGGDEFAVLIPQTDLIAAERVAEIIVATVRDTSLEVTGQLERPVTASVGIAIFSEPDLTVDELLGGADHAMYLAKSAGGNGWRAHIVA